MIANFADLLVGLKTNPGAELSSMERTNEEFGARLPESYLRLLAASNGVEGFVAGDSYLMLWPIEELPELNKGYAVDEFIPGLVLIGSNGSNDAYAIDTRNIRPIFVTVPFDSFSLDYVEPLAESAEEFLRVLKRPVCDGNQGGPA